MILIVNYQTERVEHSHSDLACHRTQLEVVDTSAVAVDTSVAVADTSAAPLEEAADTSAVHTSVVGKQAAHTQVLAVI
ncbi:hypothetical protein D3C84_913580 [compost metagenome]